MVMVWLSWRIILWFGRNDNFSQKMIKNINNSQLRAQNPKFVHVVFSWRWMVVHATLKVYKGYCRSRDMATTIRRNLSVENWTTTLLWPAVTQNCWWSSAYQKPQWQCWVLGQIFQSLYLECKSKMVINLSMICHLYFQVQTLIFDRTKKVGWFLKKSISYPLEIFITWN